MISTEENVNVTATVTDRNGNMSKHYAGSMPRWAWDDKSGAAVWKQSRRRMILDSIGVVDMRGYRVAFSIDQEPA